MKSKILCWIEAMRLRTLPVSLAGVTAAAAYASLYHTLDWTITGICALFAILAQIASNFANEYYDFKAGLDKPGRVGPRRGVTEGDITPIAMKRATFITLGLACAVGCSLISVGGWKLIVAGIFIGLGALSYSTGPYPLSRHALGEVAVFLFFGLIPVSLTYMLQAGSISTTVWAGACAIGLLGSNILIVNNYRDINDDCASGKITLAVKWGRNTMRRIYLANGLLAVALMSPAWIALPHYYIAIPTCFLLIHYNLWKKLGHSEGTALNPLLGKTAILMFLYTILFLLSTFI